MAFCSIALAIGIVGALAAARRLAWHRHHPAFAYGGPWGGGCGARAHGAGFGPGAAFGPWAWGPWGGGPWAGSEGPRGGGRHRGVRGFGKKRFVLRLLSERLEATPAQEREIDAAISDFRAVAKDARDGLRAARENVARGFEGDSIDEIALGEATVAFDTQSAKVKEAFEAALRRIHAALDPEQRRTFAELLASGPSSLWRRPEGFGPYRS